jgi:hypothetical protein
VKAIIEPTVPGEAEKVQIAIQTGEEPNQEIRIANTLTNAQAETVALKRGAALRLGISLSNLSRKLQPNIPRIPVRNLCGNSPNKSVKPARRATLCPQLSRSWLAGCEPKESGARSFSLSAEDHRCATIVATRPFGGEWYKEIKL